jgi:uncharacterized membrane protein YoaK (UPF0700 family)
VPRARAPSRAQRSSLKGDARLLVLALAGGCVDAISYLGLGKVFTANMTGNTVLLAVALVKGTGADAARASVALGGFCLGAAVGVTLIGRSDTPWPRRARRAFCLELVALVSLLVLWAAIGVASIRYALIAIAGVAMGAQSASVRASDVRGVNTTYMTSTLLNAIARVVERARGRREQPKAGQPEAGPSLPGAAWLTYAIGALAGAFAVDSWHAGAVAIAIVSVAVASAEPGRRHISQRM